MKTSRVSPALALLVMASAVTAVSFAFQPRAEADSNFRRIGEPGAPANSQQTYELRCRGGGLRFSNAPGRSLPTGEQMTNMTVAFAAGTEGAGGRAPNLRPGQCSWVDRGFRPGEPTQLRFEIVHFAQQKQVQHGSSVDRSPTAAERYPDAQNVPQYLGSPSRYWSFRAYNTNNGYLQATAGRHWKPAIKIYPQDKIKVSPIGRPNASNVNRRD